MPFDAESRSADQPKAEAPASPLSVGRRPLGRGLEDVSHLFLPQTTEVSTREPTIERASERVSVRPGVRAGAAVLRPGEPITRDQLTATLRECQGALEDNMRAIDVRVPCCPRDEIDLLALDRANQLTIIDVEITLGDGLLLRGVSHVDWVVRNVGMLQRMYQGWTIDGSRQPRLILVAPQFSPFLRSAVRQITRPDVMCYRYHGVQLSGGTGIFFEPVGGESE
jgi:hypothetical protein